MKISVQDILQRPDGQRLVEVVCKLLSGNQTTEQLIRSNIGIFSEVVYEAELILLIKKNIGISSMEQSELLRKNGYHPHWDLKRGVYVFFGSSFGPECDSYVYWNEIEKQEDCYKVDWREVGF